MLNAKQGGFVSNDFWYGVLIGVLIGAVVLWVIKRGRNA